MVAGNTTSPETIKALADLIEAAGNAPGSAPHNGASFFSPEGFTALAALVSAIIWPLVVIFIVMIFRRSLAELFAGITEFELPGGIKAKVRRALAAAAAEALPGRGEGPTAAELKRATIVEELVSNADIAFVRQQADELAAEYERVRASMRPSERRTREMEMVVAKMRVIGRAAFSLRHELAASAAPGKRLQAVAILQVEPDEDYFVWLAERVAAERPFVGYHALVALNAAANREDADRYLPTLLKVAQRSEELTYTQAPDSERQQLMAQFRRRVTELAGKRSNQ